MDADKGLSIVKQIALPSLSELHEWFSYDDDSGLLTRKKSRRRVAAGIEAGSVSAFGYRVVCFKYKRYFVHRLIWKMKTGKEPPEFIDHIDGNQQNNRWSNLRAASNSQNNWNAKISKRNSSGVKGVHWDASRHRWFAQITIGGRRIPLGRYASIEEATVARHLAAKRLHGEFARHA